MNIVLSIFGIIFIIWFFVVFIWNIILYIIHKFADYYDYTSLKRCTTVYNTEFNEWYFIPTFSFHIESVTKYPNITIVWLKWQYVITYHFQTEEEESIEIKARTQYLKRKHGSRN